VSATATSSALPSATVLLPVYNGEAYLSESLESLLAQDHGDFEILAIDDASRDRSSEILAEFAKKDRRLRVITRAENGGLVEALNLGLRSVSSRYVIRQDADDRAHPSRIRKSLEYFAEHRDTVLLGTWIQRIDASGNPLGLQRFPIEDAEIRWQMLFRNPFAHSTVAFNREKALSLGGYAASARHAEDYDLWTKIAALGRMTNLSEALCDYRVHSENITHRHTEEMEIQSARIGTRWLERLDPNDSSLAKAWGEFRTRNSLTTAEIKTLHTKLRTLARTHPELSNYSGERAEADLAWHFLSYLKRRPAGLRHPTIILSVLKYLPSLLSRPGARWRTN
jgi:glycosyltransferase involved in cell wall biosynthesis